MANRSVVAKLCSSPALAASSVAPRSNPHRVVKKDDVVIPLRPRNGPALRRERADSVVFVRSASDDDFSSLTSTSSSSDDGDGKTAPSFPSSEAEDGVEGVLAAFAANAAAAEEAALAAAFANVASSSSSGSGSGSPTTPTTTPTTNNNAPPRSSSAPAAAAPPPSSPSSPSSPSPALAAKIAAARAYKAAAAERAAAGAAASGSSSSSSSAPPAAAAVASSSSPSSPPRPPPAPSAPAAPAGPTFTRSTPPPPSPKPFVASEETVAVASSPSSKGDAPGAPAALFARGGAGEGSATEAAAFLRGVLSDGSKGSEEPPLDPNMRPEEFTALKRARERARGAELITVDSPTAAAAAATASSSSSDDGGGEGEREGEGEGDEAGYRPRVATWGVFPRPDNISRAYGGGRTIRPGEPLETEEEKRARIARQKAALEAYRKKVGLVVDPRDEVEATRLVAVGNELMQKGSLEEAAAEYAKAAELLPARSAVGGRARLQRAICLDSLGKSDEAFALYKSVEGHPLDSIGKETKRMLFGFQAMENLKAHTISYAATKKEYEPFFGKLKSDYDLAYSGTPPSEDDERGAAFAVVAALAVVAAPLVLFGALALNK